MLGDPEAALEEFSDPMWRGVALYRQGEFEQAAGVFAGFDTPEAALNQGYSLVFMGKYDEAVARYDRALELRPDWEPAVVNREIAVARAAALDFEGGDMTGGMLGADEMEGGVNELFELQRRVAAGISRTLGFELGDNFDFPYVAANIRALGAEAVLFGICGKDEAAGQLRDILVEHGIVPSGLVPSGSPPTTIKTRIIAHNQQVCRTDREDDRPATEVLVQALLSRLGNAQPVDGIVRTLTCPVIRF